MAKPRPVPAAIQQYARQLGLDPRAVEAVGWAESSLRRNAVGDQGTSYGPFQLHRGGALPGGRNAAWAGSDQGILYAMQQMAKYARGKSGQAAVRAIVEGFERPAAPGQEIDRAMQYYRGGGKLPSGASPTFSGPAAASQRYNQGGSRGQLIQKYAMQALDAYINDGESPSATTLMQALQEADGPIPGTAAPSVAGTQTPYGGAKGAKAMVALIREAQKRGLHVSENPFVDKVDPVHVGGSDHYKTYSGSKVGQASDISGTPQQMMAFYKWAEQNRGRLGLNDMFYDPAGYSYDKGKKWGKTIGGHGDHVHVSLF